MREHKIVLKNGTYPKLCAFSFEDLWKDVGNNTAFFAYVVANMAEVSEQLVVVCLAISQPFPLVVAISQERLLAFGADEVLNAPMLAQGGHNSALDRSPARTANRNAHTVMAST